MSTALVVPNKQRFAELSTALANTRGRYKEAKEEVESPLSTTNILNGLSMAGGAVALGAVEGIAGRDNIGGVPLDVIGGAALMGGGVAGGSTKLWYAGWGAVCGRLKDTSRKATSGIGKRDSAAPAAK
jgi:hypothetical protein